MGTVSYTHLDVYKRQEYDVKACSLDIKEKYLNTKALAKKLGYSNPLVTTDFGADPYAIVYDGRVYVYMTSDDYRCV